MRKALGVRPGELPGDRSGDNDGMPDKLFLALTFSALAGASRAGALGCKEPADSRRDD